MRFCRALTLDAEFISPQKCMFYSVSTQLLSYKEWVLWGLPMSVSARATLSIMTIRLIKGVGSFFLLEHNKVCS